MGSGYSMIPVPSGLSYLPYQIEGIQYASARKATLIADEMGLGKTIQALGVINANPEIRRIVIVTMASLVLNWWNEIDRWLVDYEIACLHGDKQITVISYDKLSKLGLFKCDLLIVDEAHSVKNSKTLRHKQVKRLSKHSERVLFLTGTPIENRIVELFGLLQILDPGAWDPAGKVKGKPVAEGEGAGFFKFALRYCGAYKQHMGQKSFWVFSGSSNLEELQEKLRSTLMIRRMKADVLEQLPEKRRQIVVVPNSKLRACSDDYFGSDFNEHTYEEVLRKLKANKIKFEEFAKKRQEEAIAKIDAVAAHVLSCLEDGRKIILFAHHSEVILGLSVHLVMSGVVLMTGDMNVSERQANVDKFMNDSSTKVIIGSIGTMYAGWNLTAASHVVFAEVDPNPGRMNQAEDRAHRIGQRDSVLVQHVVEDGSIDARLCKVLVKKQKVIARALNESYSSVV